MAWTKIMVFTENKMDSYTAQLLIIMVLVVFGFGYIWLELRAAQRHTERMLDQLAQWREQDREAREARRFEKKFGQI